MEIKLYRFLTVFLMIGLILILNIPNSAADWPTYRHDNQNTGSTYELGPSNNQLKWSMELEDVGFGDDAPLIMNDNLFISGKKHLYCYYLNNQSIKWKIPRENSYTTETLGVDNSHVFFADGSKVYCLNITNGSQIWNFTASWEVPTPITITYDKIFFASRNGIAYSIDKNTGKLLWKYDTGYEWVNAKPPIEDGKVIFAFGDNEKEYQGMIFCFDENSGKKIWSYGVEDHIGSSPTIANNKIFFGDDDWYFRCLDIGTGKCLWKKRLGLITSSPAVSKDKVYFGCWNEKIYCLNQFNGEVIWSYKTGNWVMSSPAVSDNFVYIGSHDFYVYAFDKKNGNLVWKYNTGQHVAGPITIENNSVYVFSGNRIFCFDRYHEVENQDLFLSKTDLTYYPHSVPPETESESVILYVRIHNMGKINGNENDKFITNFYDGEVHEDMILDKKTETVSKYGLNIITIKLKVSVNEPRKIIVKIIETDFIDQNISNNEANITISVGINWDDYDEGLSYGAIYYIVLGSLCLTFLVIIIITYTGSKLKKPACPQCGKTMNYPIHYQTWY